MEQKRPIVIGNVAGAMEDSPHAMYVLLWTQSLYSF